MAKIFHCEKSESPILTHDMADKQRKLANMPDGSQCAQRTSPVIQLGSLTHLFCFATKQLDRRPFTQDL